MSMPTDFESRLKSIERLLAEIEAAADPGMRTKVQKLVQIVMDLHGAGIERMLELISASPDSGDKVIETVGRDELVSSLLVLHGLHPESFDARLEQALDKVRLQLRSHQGDVELLSVRDGSVRLRLHVSGSGCGSGGQALKEMLEAAVYQGVPDIVALVIESADSNNQGFVPLEMLQTNVTSMPFPDDAAQSGTHKGLG